MSRRRQSRADRLARLTRGDCPVHGIGMPQIGNEPEPSPWSIVACPRRNCGIQARSQHHDGPAELLPEWQHLVAEARP